MLRNIIEVKSAADTDGHHGVVVISWTEVPPSSTDGHLGLTVVDDVAILSVRQAGVELLVEISHGHEGFVTAAKAKPVVARLPVSDGLTHRHVSKPHLDITG